MLTYEATALLTVRLSLTHTAQKIKFFIKDFFSKCEQIRRNFRICAHLLKKSLTENSIFCAMAVSDDLVSKQLRHA